MTSRVASEELGELGALVDGQVPFDLLLLHWPLHKLCVSSVFSFSFLLSFVVLLIFSWGGQQKTKFVAAIPRSGKVGTRAQPLLLSAARERGLRTSVMCLGPGFLDIARH